MKKTLLLLSLISVASSMCAQELLSRDETKQYADLTHRDPKLLEKTPIKITADLDKAIAAREGEYGGMVVPDRGLTAEALAKVEGNVLPVGEIWMLHLGPMADGRLIDEKKLNIITLDSGSTSVKVPLCVAGVRKTNDKLELVVYGKDKEPILCQPLKSISAKQTLPIEMDAEKGSEGGKITLKLLGKYQATLEVTELQLY